MAKLTEKQQVIELRKRGKSYSEIKKIVNVSKSSLSLWLRDIKLTSKQVKGIEMKKVMAVERYKESMRTKRKKRTIGYYLEQKDNLLPLTEKELFIAGLFLYLGEGSKVSRNTISIANTDPSVMKFVLYWMTRILKIPKNKIRMHLHLYSDMIVSKEINFWLKELKMPGECMIKPYIKKTTLAEIGHKGHGHGTCTLAAHNTMLKETILMGIRVITDQYSVNPHKFDIIA